MFSHFWCTVPPPLGWPGEAPGSAHHQTQVLGTLAHCQHSGALLALGGTAMLSTFLALEGGSTSSSVYHLVALLLPWTGNWGCSAPNFLEKKNYRRLQKTAEHCKTLHNNEEKNFKILYTTVQHCTTLHNTTKLHKTAQHCATLQKTAEHCITLYKTAQHYTTLYNTVQHCTTLYNTTRY